ncbi:response regulator [Pantoea agglomerans]
MSNIFIVDDHPVSQYAVNAIATGCGHQVVGICNNGQEAISGIRSNKADLLVIDIDIPPPNGLDVIKRVRQDGFSGGILVLTSHDDRHFVDRARSAGANGFISKNNHLDELEDAFKAILRGYDYFPRQAQGSSPATQLPDDELIATLSDREVEVLSYLAKGEMLIDIAAKLHISNKSVSTYKRRIMTKLGCENTLDIVDFARRNKLLVN